MSRAAIALADSFLFPAITCALLFCSQSNLAAEAEGKLSFDVAAGLQYDSNLSVPELDAVANVSDYSGVIEAGARYDYKSGKNEFGAGYDFFQRLQFDYSAFDLQIHNLSGRAARSLGQTTLALSGNYVYSELDGQEYLTMMRLTPAAQGFIARHWFARAAIDFSEKEFNEVTTRDSDVWSPSMRLYYFFNKFQTNVYLAYRYEDEDAASSRYSVISHRAKFGLSHKFQLFDRESRLRLEASYEDSEFQGITPSIGTERDEDSAEFSARLEVPISRKIYWELEYEYQDKTSNVDYLDYNQFMFGTKIGIRF